MLAAADYAQINAHLMGTALFQFQEKKSVDFGIVTPASKNTYCLSSLDPRQSLLLRNKKGWGKEEDGLGNRLAILVANGMFTPLR